MKQIVSIIAVIIIIVAGYFAWKAYMPAEAPGPAATSTPSVPTPTTSTFASSTLGISVQYPTAYTVNQNYRHDLGEEAIPGVQFVINPALAAGTNLSQDSGVSIEWISDEARCRANLFFVDTVRAATSTEGSVVYSVASSTDAGAGNRYEEWVYALSGSNPCVAVRYFIHSTAVGNYPEGTVQEFNRTALINEFDKIRRSLTVSNQ